MKWVAQEPGKKQIGKKNMAQRFEKEICKPTMGSEFFLWTHVSC